MCLLVSILFYAVLCFFHYIRYFPMLFIECYSMLFNAFECVFYAYSNLVPCCSIVVPSFSRLYNMFPCISMFFNICSVCCQYLCKSVSILSNASILLVPFRCFSILCNTLSRRFLSFLCNVVQAVLGLFDFFAGRFNAFQCLFHCRSVLLRCVCNAC